MSRLLALCMLLLGLDCPASEREASQPIQQRTIEFKGIKRSFSLFVPKYPGKKPLPLMIVHHGTGGTGEELLQAWIPLARNLKFIVAAPRGRGRYGWEVPGDGPELQVKIAEKLRAEFNVDAQRIYLFGFSNGGDFVLYAAVQQAEYFAGACVHQASLRPRQFPMLDLVKRKVPLRYSMSEKDAVYPLSETRPTVAAFRQRKWPIEDSLRIGEAHGAFDIAVVDGCWRFLSRHKLGQQPKATPLSEEWLKHALK